MSKPTKEITVWNITPKPEVHITMVTVGITKHIDHYAGDGESKLAEELRERGNRHAKVAERHLARGRVARKLLKYIHRIYPRWGE